MKNIFKYIYVLVFMIISLAPMIMYISGHRDKNDEKVNIEKNQKLSTPKLMTNHKLNENFDDECEAWLNQNIPYRGELISKFNIVLSDVLKMPTANVVTGKGGWIFSTETLDNYMDENFMTKAELKALGVTLSLVQEKVEAGGGQFLFVPVPNKNSIYPEYMPIRYTKAEDNNLTRLYEELYGMGVNYVDLKQELLAAKEQYADNIYYKSDTHWNGLGAVAGYTAIMKKLGKTLVVDTSYNYSVQRTKRGDLDKLLYPTGGHFDNEYIIDKNIDYESFSFINPSDVEDTKEKLLNFMSDKEDHDNDFTTRKKVEGVNSSLYMIRDSFARALLPYMIETYDEARFVRSSVPSFENIVNGSDVIYEICERNLRNVIREAPVMYAPLREDYGTVVYSSEENTCVCENEGYAYRIYGTLTPEMVAEDGRIYIRLIDKNNKTIVFEAFPIYNENSGCGYSAYIDNSMLGDGDYNVKILSGNFESDVLAQLSSKLANSQEADNVNIKENPYKAENEKHQIVLRGVKIGIGDNILALKSKLGNQSAPSETIFSCLSGEDALLFHYPNIKIETDMEGYIYYISLMADTNDVATGSDAAEIIATESGIALGSDKMDIWKKLGKPVRENDKNCIYMTEHIKIMYSYKAGKVTSVILEESDGTLPEEEISTNESQVAAGFEYENGYTYLYDENHELMTGWQKVDDEYYYFNKESGERIVDDTVDGIEIGPDGELKLSEYETQKIETMIKAHNIILEITDPTDTMEEKRKKAFDWILSFPYYCHRNLGGIYQNEGVELLFANDIFDEASGDCVSEAAALAFLFHDIGCKDVYWVHDTGHSWVRCEDRLYDPLFAEARDYDANYNAPFTDYRESMAYNMLIY